jgi:hypothetical protein
MDVPKILALIPDSILEDLAIETGVNKYSKKLQGPIIFKLLIYCILSYKDNSLRTMESAYESITFGLLNNGKTKSKGIRYSSISERLTTIDASYFEKLYYKCVSIYGKEIGESSADIIRFDSSIVAHSSHLLKVGYHLKGGGANHVKQLKFTIGLSQLPITANVFLEQKYTSENVALKEAILSKQLDKSNAIRIFDRGITSRKTYDDFTAGGIPFISRVSIHPKHTVLKKNKLRKKIETKSLRISSDSWVYLFESGPKESKYPVRLIQAIKKDDNEEIIFVTNIEDLTTEQITSLYKRRWDIEVFFKFLKQELNFSHLINRSENGIRVMLYSTLIASILLLVYKSKNKLEGYKIMRLRFVNELEKSIMKDIVMLCDGNPDLFSRLFEKPPP